MGASEATSRLISAFGDVSQSIREEALSGIVSIGGAATPLLLAGLKENDSDIAAGCAEALRQQDSLPESAISELLEAVRSSEPPIWVVWLLGHIPREKIASSIAEIQPTSPELHYAISLLWSFVESWIAKRWELFPGLNSKTTEDGDAI